MSSPQPVPYSKKQIFQFMAVFYAAAALCLTTIMLGGQAPPPPLGNELNLFLIVIGTAVVLPLALWFDVRVRPIRLVFHTLMHLMIVGVILFYSGSYNPLMVVWLALCIVTYIEFGRVSFYVSSVVLIAAVLLFCFLLAPLAGENFNLTEYVFYSLTFAAALIITAYIITRIIDSSDRRRLELEKIRKSEAAQLNKVNVLLNSISDAILTLDSEGRVSSQNAAAMSFFDTNETLMGRKISDILKIADDKNEPINVSGLIEGISRSHTRDDVVLHNEEQGNMRLSLQMAPIYTNNERQGVVMVLRDVTKQKTLEDEKDEFISVASHELRTPIAVAEASLSNLVLMQEKGMDPDKLKKAAETAHDEVVYLAGVVNDLSTLSRAERGVADKPEPVDMDQLLHDLYTRYEPSATKKSLQFNLDLKGKLPVVEVSRLYVEEMLQNFITNAVKYTKEGSVTLAAEVVKDGVRCSVIDTGIGISKSDQKHLGERFWRSEDFRTRETNGTGLGLYVITKLASKVGTKLEVESRLNHGSTFSIVVPFKSHAHVTGKRTNIEA